MVERLTVEVFPAGINGSSVRFRLDGFLFESNKNDNDVSFHYQTSDLNHKKFLWLSWLEHWSNKPKVVSSNLTRNSYLMDVVLNGFTDSCIDCKIIVDDFYFTIESIHTVIVFVMIRFHNFTMIGFMFICLYIITSMRN